MTYKGHYVKCIFHLDVDACRNEPDAYQELGYTGCVPKLAQTDCIGVLDASWRFSAALQVK